MSTSVNPAASSSNVPGATQPLGKTAAKDPLANESTFLTLLVSQLQNQDPLSPVDSNQFVAQLTSYSQLEQLIGIHKDTTSLTQAANPASTGTTPASQSTSTGATN